MREDATTILDPHRANRSRHGLRVVLAHLAATLADALQTSFEITGWTVDPTQDDNGVDVRFGYSDALGSPSAGVVAFLHQSQHAAYATAFGLAFDDEGTRQRPHEAFFAQLTRQGWSLHGWGPDAHEAWVAYTDDARWRQEPVWDEGPDNPYPETVARLAQQIARVRDGLTHGTPPSVLTNELGRQGLGLIELLIVAREATGLGLRHLKSLGRWWRDGELTNPEAFDREMARLLTHPDDPG